AQPERRSNTTARVLSSIRVACLFRAWGKSFDVDAFVQSSSLHWERVWRVGEPRIPGRAEYLETSGAQVVVSDSDEFRSQVADATAFLKAHRIELARVMSTAGVEGATFDFAL